MRRIFHILLCGGALTAAPGLSRADEKALVEKGVPAITRAWSGEDYALFADLLSARTVPLPMYNGSQGKELMDRLTTPENLAACRNEKLPLETRMDNFGKLLGGVTKVLNQYQTEANNGLPVHTEAAQLTAFALRTVAVGVGLINELMPKVKKDEQYNARMGGIKKYQAGLISMYINTETSLSQRAFFDEKDLSTMLEAMAETLPAVLRAIPDDYRQELRKRLEADKDSFTNERDAANVRKMLEMLSQKQPEARPADS